VATGRRPSMGMRGGNGSTASCGYGLRLPTGMREPVLVLPSLAYWDGVHLHRLAGPSTEENRSGSCPGQWWLDWMPRTLRRRLDLEWSLESGIRRL